MGIVIKQSIRSSIIAYVGVLIGYINVLWLLPFFLEADQVGLFRLIQSSSFLLATFGQFGLGPGLVKFFPKFKHEKGFLSSILCGGVIGFILLVGVSFIFKDAVTNYFSQESGLFVQYFGLTLLISFCLVQFQLFEAYCRSLLKIVIPTFIRDVQLRFLTTLLVLLFGFDLISFDMLLKLLLVAYALIVATIMLYLYWIKSLSLSFNFRFLDKALFKKIISYSLYMLIGAGGTQIVLQIDSIMVSGELGLDATGIYTIAFFIGVVIEMPKRSITQISAPLISQAFEKEDWPAITKLYKQTSINQTIIGSLLFLGIWANLESLYSFIPNSETYIQGINVVLFIGMGKLSDMLFGTNGEIIVMSKYFKFNVIAVAILALLTIGLNFLLIPRYGIEGAAIASFLAMLVFNLSKFFFVWYKFKIQPFSIQTLKFAGIVALILFANSLFPKQDSIITDILIRSLLISTLLIGLTLLLKVSTEVNGLVQKTWMKIRK